jgi:hypothetical protein
MSRKGDDDRTRGLSVNERITQLYGLPAIAIIAVFSHQAFETKLTWMGVDLFLILSGSLITDILLRSGHRRIQAYLGWFYARPQGRGSLDRPDPQDSTELIQPRTTGTTWFERSGTSHKL